MVGFFYINDKLYYNFKTTVKNKYKMLESNELTEIYTRYYNRDFESANKIEQKVDKTCFSVRRKVFSPPAKMKSFP